MSQQHFFFFKSEPKWQWPKLHCLRGKHYIWLRAFCLYGSLLVLYFFLFLAFETLSHVAQASLKHLDAPVSSDQMLGLWASTATGSCCVGFHTIRMRFRAPISLLVSVPTTLCSLHTGCPCLLPVWGRSKSAWATPWDENRRHHWWKSWDDIFKGQLGVWKRQFPPASKQLRMRHGGRRLSETYKGTNKTATTTTKKSTPEAVES